MSDEVRAHRRVLVVAEGFEHARLELRARDARLVAVLNPEAKAEHVAHEREGQAARPLARAAVKGDDVLGQKLDLAAELVEQARLADSRVSDEREHLKLSV